MVTPQHLRQRIRYRTQRVARTLGPALFAAVTALSAAAQSYSVTNLGLAGAAITSISSINPNNEVTGMSYMPAGYYRAFYATQADGTIDIGTLGGSGTIPWGMNASGQIVGASDIFRADGLRISHAFSWTKEGGVVDLGTLGGLQSRAIAVNDFGVITGESQTADGKVSGFLWTKEGGMVALPSLGNFSQPLTLNAAGQVVGYSRDAAGVFHAVLWNPGGGIVDLGTLPGTTRSSAEFITDAGLVVGRTEGVDGSGNATLHPFVYTASTGTVDLGTLGGQSAWAVRVNPSGRVIGTSRTATNNSSDTTAFTWTQLDGLVPLTFGGASEARGINASGQVVGIAASAAGDTRAFSWTKSGGMVDLGSFGTRAGAYAVNRLGQVVGFSTVAGPSGSHAFLYENATLKDLNDHLSSKPAGLELFAADRISDGGSIIAITSAGFVLLSPGLAATAPPVVGQISANDPIAVGVALSVSASFTDAASDTHTATWTWGDGTAPQAGAVSEANGSGTASGSHVFAAAGVYPVIVTVTDSTGLMSTVSRNVVVYDPSAGFVTGSGWIDSPPGAFKLAAAATGRGMFSFVSKYQKGASVPDGETEFQFQAANLEFHSDAYDWLVVAGARAQFKGIGTLNGIGGYRFLLTAVDGATLGADDRFRIKIFYYDAVLDRDVVVYDNQLNSGAEGTVQEGTAIGGGSIVVHAAKK